MDTIDKNILNVLQKDFPLVENPFEILAEKVGIPEEEIIDRITRMKRDGIIRRIGAIFDTRKIGFVSTLCAARVPEEHLRHFVETVNSYPGVTHNYRRTHTYNVWFTCIAENDEQLEKILEDLRRKTGISDILSMKAIRTFKIDASFTV